MSERRLAAIMFTDIVGYTALMGSDEERAFEILRKNREIHTGLIGTFNGILIKEMGDGMLVSFNLASDAVRCAIEIQKSCKKEKIPLRIGIHEGEMVFDGTDIYGDGVNIASRLQQAAEAGCIAVSGTVYADIKNKTDIQTKFIGKKTFKNVDESVKVYQVRCDAFAAEGSARKASAKISDRWRSAFAHPIITISTGAIGMLAVAIVIIFLFYRGRSVPFAERDWIVISDFDNLTGDSIFDHSLNTAFLLSTNQSRYINVFPRQRMRETLKRMKKGKETNIDEATGREIALREGIKVCIVPGISRVGDQYILTAKIIDTKTGANYRSEILYAKNQDEIIEKLDELSKKVRRNLGETMFEIFEQSKPLTKVTTSSLKALKQYSLGIDYHINLEFKKAIAHYKSAIRLDSNFVSAKASLGNLLFERYDRDEGRKWLNEAIRSIDNLTDREKYGILAFYAVNVENDMNKGIEYTKMRTELYPDDPVPHNNLGWYLQNTGHYKEAVEEYKIALRIDPYMMLTYGGMVWVYLENLGQMDSALTWSKKMIKYGPENPWGYFYLGSAYVGIDSLGKAERAYLRAGEMKPGFLLNQYRLAHVYRLRGKYNKAIELLNELLRSHPEEKTVHYDLGVNYQLSGNQEQAAKHFLKFKETATYWEKAYPEDPESYITLGVVLTRLGEKSSGWKTGKRAIEMDSSLHFRFAQLLAVQERNNEALDHLEKALANGYRDLTWIKLHPDLQALQGDAGFQTLIRKYFGPQ